MENDAKICPIMSRPDAGTDCVKEQGGQMRRKLIRLLAMLIIREQILRGGKRK